ncbi:cysteine hydrolase [Phenylobacterium sp.]|jgi:nicotinamidase-related amidase|uniref:cysteine hydrolase n=1 Tax=Phenylobacterium sp. TaxID=1871053 RepID=UPI002F42C7DC
MAITLESLLQPGRVAFVMCEVQPGVIGEAAPWPALTEAAAKVGLIPNAARIAQAARDRAAPVVHCTAERLPGQFGANANARLFGNARKRGAAVVERGSSMPVPEVWRDGDIHLPRFHGTSPMTGGPLDSLLRNQGVTTVVLSGVSLCFAVLNTTFDAVNRSYQVIIPRDAAAGFPEAYAEQVLANTLSMLATITTTDELLAAWPAA